MAEIGVRPGGMVGATGACLGDFRHFGIFKILAEKRILKIGVKLTKLKVKEEL